MKYRISVGISLILAFALVALVAAQTPSSGSSGSASASQGSSTSSQPKTDKTKKLHLPPNFSADEAYKQNCTRCHSEVPPVNARRTKTIVRHMRVRANITADEAEAILQYLTQ